MTQSSRAADLPTQPKIPFDVTLLANPSQDELRRLALAHTPFCQQTALGSINKVARNKARQAKYTYIIDRRGEPEKYSHNTISPEKAQALIDGQAAYVREKGTLLAIERYVGLGPRSVPVQWLYTIEGANIAAMQQITDAPLVLMATSLAAFGVVWVAKYVILDKVMWRSEPSEVA